MVKHAVILAGGAGTRLWPASTARRPKQLLELGQGRTLFGLTLERASGLEPQGLICVVTHRDQVPAIVRECARVLRACSFDPDRVLVLAEPQARNTAPAIALACAFLRQAAEAADTLLVLPADHAIEPLALFAEDVERAAALAETGRLVTFGIPPEGPETGYGYIEAGQRLGPGYAVKRFKEKPDLDTARAFLDRGGHYWNSGMFAFRIGDFFAELEKRAPRVAGPFLGAELPGLPEKSPAAEPEGPRILEAGAAVERIYRRLPSISIDYALMEKSDRAAMVPARFSWSDVGSWDAVAELFGPELERGREQLLLSVESQDNFVLADLPVALAGVEDLVVVVRNGVVLICRKGRTQLVRELVQDLKDRGRSDLL